MKKMHKNVLKFNNVKMTSQKTKQKKKPWRNEMEGKKHHFIFPNGFSKGSPSVPQELKSHIMWTKINIHVYDL
jgi:hypothetical protein